MCLSHGRARIAKRAESGWISGIAGCAVDGASEKKNEHNWIKIGRRRALLVFHSHQTDPYPTKAINFPSPAYTSVVKSSCVVFQKRSLLNVNLMIHCGIVPLNVNLMVHCGLVCGHFQTGYLTVRWRERFQVNKCSRKTLLQLPSSCEREESLSSRSWWRRSLFCCWWFWPCRYRWSCRRRSLLADSFPFRPTRWVSDFCWAGQLPTSKLSGRGGAGAGAVVVDVVGLAPDRKIAIAILQWSETPTALSWKIRRRAVLTCQFVVAFIRPIFFYVAPLWPPGRCENGSVVSGRPTRSRFFYLVYNSY